MTDFTTWFKELKESNPIWWDALPLAYPKKDYVQLAKECYVHLLSNCQTIMKNKDWERMRNTYQKFLLYGKEKTDVEKMPEAEPVVIHPQALTGEQRAKRLQEFYDMVQAAPIMKPIAKPSSKELIENGDWRPKPETIREPSEVEKRVAYISHLQSVRQCRRKMYLEAYPEADDQEIEAYCDQFKDIDDPLKIF